MTDVNPETVVVITDKLEQYFQAATEVITKYGGQAVDLGLMVLRIEAGQGLVFGLCGLIVGAYLLMGRYSPATLLKLCNDSYGDGKDVVYFFGTLFSALGVVIGFVMAAVNLFDIWNWIGIVYPEAYAVHKFLLK